MPKGNRGTSRFEILVNPNKSLNEGVSYLPISGFLVLWQNDSLTLPFLKVHL